MTKADRKRLDQVTALAATNPTWCAATLATMHRCAATARDARPRVALSGRLVDLRALLARHGDVPLRVLVRDMAADTARMDAPDAIFPAR